MLQLLNISPTYRISVRTGTMGGINRPAVINLGPDEHINMLQSYLHNWDEGPKQDLAKYVQMGMMRIVEMDSAHHGFDLKNRLEWPRTITTLDEALAAAIALRTEYNRHIGSSVHTAPDTTNPSILADPTDQPTLNAFVTDLQSKYTAHIPLGSAHPNPDVVNVLVLGAPTDLPTSIAALNEIFSKLTDHKREAAAAGTPPLTPAAVITY